jgi:hypothetical protein
MIVGIATTSGFKIFSRTGATYNDISSQFSVANPSTGQNYDLFISDDGNYIIIASKTNSNSW